MYSMLLDVEIPNFFVSCLAQDSDFDLQNSQVPTVQNWYNQAQKSFSGERKRNFFWL